LQQIYFMQNRIIGITGELLSNGIFNHLPDEELYELHRLLLKDKQATVLQLMDKLTSYWYKGAFFYTDVSPRLIQECNEYLQRMGKPMIETNHEVFDEV